MNKLFLSLICISIFFSNIAIAETYYVAKNGNDNNIGSKKQPFKTLKKATTILKEGDICIIREGIYKETLVIETSGTASSPIIFKRYKDEKVVIDATENIDSWLKHKGNIFKSNFKLPLSSVYNTLYFEKELINIARWPNNSDQDNFTFDGHKVDNGSANHFEITDIPDINLKGAFFCYLGAHSGTSWTREILDNTKNSITHKGVNIKQWPYTPHSPTIYRNHNRGQLYIFGKQELLDSENEWYYDEKNEIIYAMFPKGATPQKGNVCAAVRPSTIELKGNHIQIDGIDCFGGTIKVFGNNCSIKNGIFSNCSQSYEGLIGISAQSEYASIIIKASDIKIENNLIEYGASNGIALLSGNQKNLYVANNVIRYFNTIGIHANPIRSRAEKTILKNNTIYTCGRDGIYTSSQNCEIAYNDVYDCMRINNDGGVFYTVGGNDLKNTDIHHNWFHDSFGPSYADGRAAGIYLDNNSKGYNVYNNIISNITWGALYINWYNKDINFYHNTIWEAGSSMGRWANGHKMERIRLYNNYANKPSANKDEKSDWIGTEFKGNLVIDQSPFINAAQNDFRLKENSALIDKGTVIKGFTKKDKTPDVGALQYKEKMFFVGATWANDVVEDKIEKSTKRGEIERVSEDDF